MDAFDGLFVCWSMIQTSVPQRRFHAGTRYRMAVLRILAHRRIRGRQVKASLLQQQSGTQHASNCVKDAAKEDLQYSSIMKFRKP